MNENPHNNLTIAFAKLKKEVKGVKHAFIFPKQAAVEPENSLEKKLRYLMYGMSGNSFKKISIKTFKGEIMIYMTKTFFLGAVITADANPTLVEMILTRIVSGLDDFFESFNSTHMRTIEEIIQERIKSILRSTRAPVLVTLTLRNPHVEGEIKVTATSRKEQEQLKEEIQNILDEEIPLFCKKSIIVEIKMEYPNLSGVTRQHLLKVINKIQEI